MTMSKYLVSLLVGGVLSLGNLTYADNLGPEDINILALNEGERLFNYGFKAGTLGVGFDLSTPINEWMSLRFNANGLNYSSDDDLGYNGLLKTDKTYELQTFGLLVDYHLAQLRLTTGVYINNNSIVDIVKPTATSGLYIDGINYNSTTITQVDQTISFNTVSPYVGIGWGNNSYKEGWNMTFDVGLLYHSDPQLELDLTLNQNITLAEADAIRSHANEEIKVQEKNLSDFPFYPVVMVGFSYSFSQITK